jgi:hypothetical protein
MGFISLLASKTLYATDAGIWILLDNLITFAVLGLPTYY